MKYYTASKSRNQGRESWSVIFRHPARLDVSTGKTGRRVRRGLGTADEAEAERLVEQLNEILASPELWATTARGSAVGRFGGRVIDIVYDGLQTTTLDFAAIRESLIPLPARDEFPRVLLLGTTGAGKTTLGRQIMETDPRTERFPSTSTARTTLADGEFILVDGDVYRIAATFMSRDEVVDYLSEIASGGGPGC